MVEVRFEVATAAPPERVLEAATDFSEQRPGIWSGIDPGRYRIHTVGELSADVTEGGPQFGGIWAREHYDWAVPGMVTAEVQESNVFKPGSRWELCVRPGEGGGSRVEWVSIRRPRGLKGAVVVAMLKLAGRRYLASYLRETLTRLEREPAS